MTSAQIYKLLFEGGNYSRPYLIKFTHPTAGTLRFVNNNETVTFADENYIPANFKYIPPNSKGEGGNLEISAINNENLFAFVENADYQYKMQVTGVINRLTGLVDKLKVYRHFYGTVSMGEDWNLTFSLGRDDRLDMNFTVLTYDTNLNPGNA